jgi:LysR family transcriptional activator of nhaA
MTDSPAYHARRSSDPRRRANHQERSGRGVSSPAAIEHDVCRFYGVRVIGRTDAARERYYAMSAERRLKHPGVLAITSAARDELFN